MAVVQSTYNTSIRPWVAGMTPNMINEDTDTRICETAAGLAFGIAVSQGTTDKGCVIGGALVDFVGITVRDITLVHDTADKYAEGDNVAVKAKGDIVVLTDGTVAAGDPVHYNSSTGVLGNSGGNGPIPGARWMTSCSGADLALVRLTSANHG